MSKSAYVETVSELAEFLKTLPASTPVRYRRNGDTITGVMLRTNNYVGDTLDSMEPFDEEEHDEDIPTTEVLEIYFTY